jgi:hypothetical protein
MATGQIQLHVAAAALPDGSTSNTPPVLALRKGSEAAPAKFFRVAQFDASTRQDLWWAFTVPQNYASAPILRIQWFANATAGSVVWGGRIGAVTAADADTPVEHAMATATTVTTAANTTEALRLVDSTITLANLDSVAVGDLVFVNLYRDAANGSDTTTVAAEVIAASIDYTTT